MSTRPWARTSCCEPCATSSRSGSQREWPCIFVARHVKFLRTRAASAGPGSRSHRRPRCPPAGPRRRGGPSRRRRRMFMHRATDRAFETWTPRQRNSAPPSIALPTVIQEHGLLAGALHDADDVLARPRDVPLAELDVALARGVAGRPRDAAELLAHGLHRDRVGAVVATLDRHEVPEAVLLCAVDHLFTYCFFDDVKQENPRHCFYWVCWVFC